MLTKTPFALRQNKLVSIHDISDHDKGLKCSCVCIACGNKLVARKGKRNVAHFSHHIKESNCNHALESALHFAAKEVISEFKKILLPPLIEFDNSKTIELQESLQVKFEEVILEINDKGFRPDIVGIHKGQKIFIEIAVHHLVDEEKKAKVQKRGISMIEIDLFDLQDGFTKDELIQAVIFEVKNKEWIYHSRKKKLWENYKLSNRSKSKVIKPKDNTSFKNQLNNRVCRYLIRENAKKISDNNNILNAIKNGAFWNGEMYGKGENGKYIFIDNKKEYLFPPDWAIGLTNDEEKKKKRIFGQLKRISRDSTNSSQSCPYFDQTSQICTSEPPCKKFDPFKRI